jgi:Kef-type K+ transport system membrane component KefB
MAIAYFAEKYILSPLLNKFDQVQEYIFILSVGWCLGLSQMSGLFNLSPEIGAFVAGVSLASSNISLFIAESLKPLRDFFLVMFFASIGATFNLEYLPIVIIPAIILSAAILILKPLIYSFLFKLEKEDKSVANEVGIRLGQGSEFALLVAKSAFTYSIISSKAIYFVQATTILTFVISSYFVIFLYPTPLGVSEKMRQN